jgi:glycine oxidase
VRLVLDMPGDRAIDPLELARELRRDLDVQAGRAVEVGPDRVRLDDGRLLEGRVVVAAGLGTAELTGLPIRPVKGQVLRLRDPRGPGLVERSIRTEHAYLVPRGDGRYVLGATMEERSDRKPTAGALYELVRDISEVLPGVLELEVEGFSAGLRPATPDNLPIIGRHNGLIVASGHGRNGVLLAPVTGELVAELLDKGELPEWAAPCDPGRFAGTPAEVPA